MEAERLFMRQLKNRHLVVIELWLIIAAGDNDVFDCKLDQAHLCALILLFHFLWLLSVIF